MRHLLLLIPLLVLAFPGTVLSAPGAEDAPWVTVPFGPDPTALRGVADKLAMHDAPDGWTLLWADTSVTLDAEHRLVERTRQVSFVSSESAVDAMASTELPWNPTWHDPPTLRARVVDKGGRVRDFDPSRIVVEETGLPSHDMYTGTRVSRAPLPGVAAGSFIELEWTLAEHEAPTKTGRLLSLWAWTGASVLGGRLRIEAPEALTITARPIQLAGDKGSKESRDGRQILQWTYGASRLADFGWAPSDATPYSGVFATSGRSWADVARGYSEVFEPKVDPASVAEIAKEAAGGEKDPIQAARKLMARIRADVRYEGIELGRGALVPREPSAVLAQGYGDCKDQAVLLISMLRSLGFQARAVLLRAGQWTDLLPDLPSQDAFDHVIVTIPGKTPIFIDPTSRYTATDVLPIGDRNRQVLIVDPTTKGLVRTPPIRPEDNRREIELRYDPPAHGQGTVRRVERAFGLAAAEDRASYASMTTEELQRALEGWVRDNYGEPKEVGVEGVADPESPLVFSFTAEKSPLVVVADLDASSTIRMAEYLGGLPEILWTRPENPRAKKKKDEPVVPGPKQPPRTAPYYHLPAATHIDFRTTIRRGWEAGERSEEIAVSEGALELKSTWRVTKDHVGAEIDFRSIDKAVDEATWLALRERLADHVDGAAPNVQLLHRPFQSMKEGKLAEALQEIDGIAAAEPEEPEHRAQRALLLIDSGLAGVARSMLEALTESPDARARHHYLLYLARSRDSLGRGLIRASDREVGLPSLRRAVELDPENDEWRTELGLLLCELPDKRAEGQAILEDLLAQDKAQNHKAETLLCIARQGVIQDAITFARDHQLQDQKVIYELLALAQAKGFRAIESEFERRGVRGEARSKLFGALFALSLQAEAFGLAGEFGQRVEAFPAPMKAWCKNLVDVRSIDDLDLDARTPRGALRRLVFGAMTGDKTYLDALTDTEEKAREELSAGLASGLGGMEGVAGAFGLRGFAALMVAQFEMEEIEKFKGFRVLVTKMEGLPSSENDATLMEQRDGKWRIAADLSDLSPAIRLAETLAESGREAEARWLLEYVAPRLQRDLPRTAATCQEYSKGRKDTQAAEHQCVMASAGAPKALQAVAGVLRKMDGELRQRLALVVVGGAVDAEDYELVAESAALASKDPEWAELGARLHIGALVQLGRFAEAERVARDAIRALPKADTLKLRLGDALISDGREEEADKVFEEIVSRNQERAALNQLLWNRLFLGRVGAEELKLAQTLSSIDDVSSGALHTVAAVQAEAGKVEDAVETLKKFVKVSADPLRPEDRYVVARILEQLGMREAAREEYQRVVETKADASVREQQPTWRLAERRLAAMAPSRK